MEESLAPRETPAGGEGTCRLEFSDIGDVLRDEEGRCGVMGKERKEGGLDVVYMCYRRPKTYGLNWAEDLRDVMHRVSSYFSLFFIIISASLRHFFRFKMAAPQAGYATCTAPEG